MSTAIVRVFGTAMSGRCDKRPELADTPLKLTATLSALKDNGDEELAHQLFEPLGYEVKTERLLDDRFSGYDCACVIEVIEHIEPARLGAFERSVFEFAKPKTVVLTTPNREYNANYEHMQENALRHSDHRFEWTRAEFKAWCESVCEKFGYSCEISGIGDEDENLGTPTQMGVFTRNG